MEGANELVRQLRNLAVEAADALWALYHNKEPTRNPIAINQEIHILRTKIDALFPPTETKTENVPVLPMKGQEFTADDYKKAVQALSAPLPDTKMKTSK